jgi:putative oxidoreductase
MRRLLSAHARGAPGVGLLLARVAAGVGLLVPEIHSLRAAPGFAAAFVLTHGLALGLGSLMLVGLWTQVAGVLVAAGALWQSFHSDDPSHWVILAALGAALALTGPGTWSIDALRFGWQRLDIPVPRSGKR